MTWVSFVIFLEKETEVPKSPGLQRNRYFCSMTAYTDPYYSLLLNLFTIQMVYRIFVTVSIIMGLVFPRNQNPLSLFSNNFLLIIELK